MLLCCFRDPKDDDDNVVYRKSSSPKKASSSSPKSNSSSSTNSNLRREKIKERAPLCKEEKRLVKQRSRESVRLQLEAEQQDRAVIVVRQQQQFSFSSGFQQQQLQQQQQQQHKSTPVSPVHHYAPVAATPILPQSISLQFDNRVPSSLPPPPPAPLAKNGDEEEEDEEEEDVVDFKGDEEVTRGMTRSSASYGIQQMLQEQIVLEDNSKKKEEELTRKHEALIADLKRQQIQALQELEERHTTTLRNARNIWQSERERLCAQHHSELERVRTENEARIKEYKDKDDAWQQEKLDVVSEIHRLKEEANRFIAILAADEQELEQEENLSPGRKQTLTREVESLQLVVEMRTQEIHRLRQERTRHLAQLEDFERTKGDLAKLKAKVEDLEVQLQRKDILERQLSLEKSNLENNFEAEFKRKERVAMQVEELQWRIKNKMELPPPKVYTKRPDSLQTSPLRVKEEEQDRIPSVATPNNNNHADSSCGIAWHTINNNNFGSIVSKPNREGTESSVVNGNLELDLCSSSSSTSSSNSEHRQQQQQDEKDLSEPDLSHIDSLQSVEKLDSSSAEGSEVDDEGLGDISSESASPQPTMEVTPPPPQQEQQQQQLQQQQQQPFRPKTPPPVLPKSLEATLTHRKLSLLSSPADERMPSRISLSVQTTL